MKTKKDASEIVANENGKVYADRITFWECFWKCWNSNIKIQRKGTQTYCIVITMSFKFTAMLYDTQSCHNNKNKRECWSKFTSPTYNCDLWHLEDLCLWISSLKCLSHLKGNQQYCMEMQLLHPPWLYSTVSEASYWSAGSIRCCLLHMLLKHQNCCGGLPGLMLINRSRSN